MSRNLSSNAQTTEAVGQIVARPYNDELVTEPSGGQFASVSGNTSFVTTSLLSASSASYVRSIVSDYRKRALTEAIDDAFANGSAQSLYTDFVFPQAVAADGSVVGPSSASSTATLRVNGGFTPVSAVGSVSLGFSPAAIFNQPSSPTGMIAYSNLTAANSTSIFYSLSTDGGLTWTNSSITSSLFVGASAASAGSTNSYGFTSVGYAGSGLPFGGYTLRAYASTHWVYPFAARILRVALNAAGTATVASLSADGFTNAGADASVAVFGAASLANANPNVFFAHKNGNAGFFTVGSGAAFTASTRYTADGGVTWTGSTGGPTGPAMYSYKVNGSSLAKLVMHANSVFSGSSATAYVTSNTGQTWTSVTLPFSFGATNDSLAYVGSIGAVVNPATRRLYITTNDFTTTTIVPETLGVPNIAGVTGPVVSVFNDNTRIYVLFASNQIAHTTDGLNWTVRNVSGPLPPYARTITTFGIGFAKIGNRAILEVSGGGFNYCYFTADDAATWQVAYPSRAVLSGGQGVSTRSTGGMMFAVGTSHFFLSGRGNVSINGAGADAAFLIPATFTSDPKTFSVTAAASISPGTGAPFQGVYPYLKLS